MSSTIIDHAIAIPTKQHNVWEQISDITKFPVWHVDTQAVSFLTTKHSGRGTRYRATTRRGRERVIEITAWYEGLGFEYIIVDGSPYASNRGRIRLQESTDGTIVQWTFTYELTGFLSGLRNSLVVRRGVDNDIIDNLRNIYTYIKELRGEEHFVPEEAKSYLKEAPDVLARSQYQPRYPSKSDPKIQPVPETATAGVSGIIEPPLVEGDTKPNPSIQPEPTPPAEPISEPTFLKDVPDFSQVPSETQVKPEPLPRLTEAETETESVTAPTPTVSHESTSALPIQAETPPVQKEEAVPPITASPEPPVSDDSAEADAVYTDPLPGLETSETSDSSKVSVF
ncbi:MAG: SRPBCC family protein [Anaerolineae bacterium]|nr:SRPBCC family protein [Anaerolineae bacterium]